MNFKRYISNLLAFSILLCSCLRATAQEKNITQTNQQWIHYYVQLKLSDSWSLQADGSYRWKEAFEESSQYLLRLMTTYRITPMLSTSGGLTYSATFGTDGLSQIEFRPFQDLNFRNEFRFFELTQRFRVEERFINPVSEGKILTPNSFNFRFRYSLAATIPLLKLSKGDPDKALALTIGDELFLNSGKSIVTNVFDQNRFFTGPILKWNKTFTSALLWNRQFASTADPATFRRTHVLWLQIRHQIN